MEYKKIRISIKNIRQNGVLCPNPTVAWITQPGIFYPCIGKDYIEVEVPVGADPRIEFVIQCDDCDACPPEHIVRYMCDTSHDCDDCEICNEHGYCEPLCPDELCIDGTCVDCVDDDDCPPGMICVGGKCECPAGTVLNARGECVQCLSDAECPKCTWCVGGKCEPLECICDPVTGKCVECVTTGDCDGPNECCVNNKCECCPGYIWDHTLQQCVEKDECYRDTDCPVCYKCESGRCVEMIAPNGWIYIAEGNNCNLYKICTCGSKECPHNHACVEYKEGICICIDCTGKCDQGQECKDGCDCTDTGDCVPSKCTGDCTNAAECGDGCGCYNGKCVPCDLVDCRDGETDCLDIIGCECYGNNCRKIGRGECENTCTSSTDCAEDCGCFNGECYPCSYFDCDDNGDCHMVPGCDCDYMNKCVDDGTYKDGGDQDCLETLTLIKEEGDCTLTAELTNLGSCLCSPISLGVKVEKIGEAPTFWAVQVKGELRKGPATNLANFNTLPRLDDTSKPKIANNETPTTGTLTIYTQTTIQSGGAYIVLPPKPRGVLNFAGKAVAPFDLTVPKIGYTGQNSSTEESLFGESFPVNSKVVSVKFYYEYSKFEYPNDCSYNKGELGGFPHSQSLDIKNATFNSSNFFSVGINTTNGTRDPMFTWYKHKETSYNPATAAFYKQYIPFSFGKYTSTLFGMNLIPADGLLSSDDKNGELENNRYYTVEVDCGCAEAASIGKLYFCNPENAIMTNVVEWNDPCGYSARIKEFEPCHMNQEILQGMDADTQAYYYIEVNGEIKEHLRYYQSFGKLMKVNQGSQAPSALPITVKANDGETITSIEIKLGFQNNPVGCVWTYTPPAGYEKPDLTWEAGDCFDSGKYYYLTLQNPAGWHIQNVELAPGFVSQHFTTSITGTGALIELTTAPTTLLVTYTNGCEFEYDFPGNRCEDATVELVIESPSFCQGDLDLRAVVSQGVGPYAFVFSVPGKTGGRHYERTTETTASFAEGTFGTGFAMVEVIDINGQEASDQEQIYAPKDAFSATPLINVCINEPYTITVTAPIGSVITSSIPGYNTFTMTESTKSIPMTAPAGEGQLDYIYTTMQTVNPTCFVDLNAKTRVNTIDLPTATLTSAPTVCNGPLVPTAALVGDPSANVTINIYNITTSTNLGNTTKIIPAGGTTTINLPTIAGVYEMKIIKVTLGQCENTAQGPVVPVTVFAMPTAYVVGDYTCAPNLATYSVVVYATLMPTASQGSVSAVAANTWLVSGITSGEACVLTVTNGACVKTITTAAHTCGCGDLVVPPPVADPNQYYWCQEDPIPELVVTVEAGHTARWYAQSVGGTALHTGLTYTPLESSLIVGGNTVFYAEAMNAITCVSTRTAVSVFTYYEGGIAIIPATPAPYCIGDDVNFSVNIWYPSLANTGYWESDDVVFEDNGTYITVTVGDAPFTLSYTVDTINGCTTTLTQTYDVEVCYPAEPGASASCGDMLDFAGGECYSPGTPCEYDVDLGSDTGEVTLILQAGYQPDRVIVEWDGGVEIDTGYRGSTYFNIGGGGRTTFGDYLTDKLDPIGGALTYPDTLISGTESDGFPTVTSATPPNWGNYTTSFTKTGAAPATATVKVYGSSETTLWNLQMSCPEV